MEVTSIQNGIIIDHVPAGTALKVLEYLKIDPSKTKLALIMNTDSHMYGTKDIIKIEDETESIDLDVLGLVARTATVGIVRGGKIVEKKKPTLPEHVAVGVHDQRELGLSRINFQVFEHLERGASRHMVDDDAVLNAGDFHQAATSLDSSGSYPGSSSPTTELSNAMRISMPFLTCSK